MTGGIDLGALAERIARDGFGEWIEELLLTEAEWDRLMQLVAQLGPEI